MKRILLFALIGLSLFLNLNAEKLYTVMSDANGVIKAPSVISGKFTNSSLVGSFFFDGTLSNVTLIGSSISNVNVGVGIISNASIYGGEAFDLSISNSVIKKSLITNSVFQGDGANITNINPSNVKGLKTMAFQNSNEVQITGGTLTDVTISGDGSGLTNLFKGAGTTGLITIAAAPGNKFLRDDGVFAAPESANATNVFWEDVQLKPDVLLNYNPVVIGGNDSNNFSVQIRTTANKTQQVQFYDNNTEKLRLKNNQPSTQAELWSANTLIITSSQDVVIPQFTIGKNRLINGGFEFFERNEEGSLSIGDDTYCADRFYVLSSQDDSIVYDKVSNPFNGAVYAGRILNDGVSSRIGLAQIIESANCVDLRAKTVTFSGFLKTSANSVNQVAILEWQGTKDSVLSDVVAEWGSQDYTISAFFSNTTDLVVGNVQQVELTANTWTKFSVSANLSGAFNNLIIFVFGDEDVPASFTYQYANFQLEKGGIPTQFEYRPSQLEQQLCERYLQRFEAVVDNGIIAGGLVTSSSTAEILFPISPMRASPQVNALIPSNFKIKDGSVTNAANNTVLFNASNRGAVITFATGATLTTGRAAHMLGQLNKPILFNSEL